MSSINPNNIDGTFPIAGQDNSSQGFRDNFTNIRNNFSYAQSEISDLQAKAITASALTGGTLNNQMNYNQLINVQLTSPSDTYVDLGTPSAGQAVILDYSQGSVQKITTNGNFTISFTNWPYILGAKQYARMLLWVTVSSKTDTLTFSTSSPGVTLGFSDLANSNTTTGVVGFDSPGTYLISFETIDGGQNILAKDASRNSATFRDSNFYFNDNVSNTLLVGFGGNINVTQAALGADAGRSTVVADGQFSAVSVGNLQLANLTYSTLDTGPLAGYNITSTRGNLQSGTYTPVRGGDLLGYHNAVTLTGNGTPTIGNVFQQVSTIAFYATGANLQYGLGGNIVMATGKDGDVAAIHTVYQAVGIENDQSTKFFGNVITANVFVPGSGSTVGGVAGQISFDAGYIYVCIGPGNWKRAALSSF